MHAHSCYHAGILEQGLQLRWLDMHQAFATYESHVLFVLRFMIDCNVVGGGWVELPAGAYCLTPKESRSSHCQIEAHVLAAHIVTHAPEGAGTLSHATLIQCTPRLQNPQALPQIQQSRITCMLARCRSGFHLPPVAYSQTQCIS